MGGFEINERGMREIERSLQRRFAQMKIRVPVEADLGSNNVFITTGDRAQVVVGDNRGIMSQGSVRVPVGYESVAVAVQELSDLLRGSELLTIEDAELVAETEAGALAELTQGEPDRKRLGRLLATLRGVATPFLAALSTEAGKETAAKLGDLMNQVQLPMP